MQSVVTGKTPRLAVIMRGLSGSGKSYIAKSIRSAAYEAGLSALLCSADDYFSLSGSYSFSVTKLVRSACGSRSWSHVVLACSDKVICVYGWSITGGSP